jgi:hypothetical protein
MLSSTRDLLKASGPPIDHAVLSQASASAQNATRPPPNLGFAAYAAVSDLSKVLANLPFK